MKLGKTTKKTLQSAFDPFEVLTNQVGKGILEEAIHEVGGFFGSPKNLGSKPREIATADLQRARKQEEIKEMDSEDSEKSKETALKIQATINEYRQYDFKVNSEQSQMKQEFAELRSEVVQLASASGVKTNVHLENTPHKIGVLDLKRLTAIIRFLRFKAEESKSAKDMVTSRQNAKPATGMLAWVSGKQMKIHEQGTMQLQG